MMCGGNFCLKTIFSKKEIESQVPLTLAFAGMVMEPIARRRARVAHSLVRYRSLYLLFLYWCPSGTPVTTICKTEDWPKLVRLNLHQGQNPVLRVVNGGCLQEGGQ